jgi:hypothetical protein
VQWFLPLLNPNDLNPNDHRVTNGRIVPEAHLLKRPAGDLNVFNSSEMPLKTCRNRTKGATIPDFWVAVAIDSPKIEPSGLSKLNWFVKA